MIINVRGCSNRAGIIVSYLVENEEKTGYDSFNAKKITVKNKVDMLAAIKKTLISSRKLPEINAGDFISTINKVGKKGVFDTSLKTIVKSVNDENMQPTMATLSHVYFNNKPLSQVKAINIINGNMYFMIKVGSSYNLELIKSERIKCMIVISSLVNLYRRIKQGGTLPKGSFKKHYISRPRLTPSATIRNIYHSWDGGASSNSDEDSPAESIILEEGAITNSRPAAEEVVPPPTNGNNWYGPTLYTYPEGISTRRVAREAEGTTRGITIEQAESLSNMNIPTTGRQRTEQRERVIESLYTGLIETNETEERPANAENAVTERPIRVERIVVPGARIAAERRITREAEVAASVAETMVVDESSETDENERPIGIDCFESLEIQASEANLTNTDREETDEDEEDERPRIDLAAAEERYESLEIQIPEAGLTNTDREETEAEPTIIEERNQGRNRRSFIEYLRENQNGAFNNLRENNNTSTGHQ